MKAFAWRIQDKVDEINKTGLFELVFSRHGGEEFEVFAANLENKDALFHLAETFRKIVEDKPLPDEEQFEAIAKDLNIDPLKVPRLQDRLVKTSIGFSSTQQVNKNWVDVYARLQTEADTALYRAKSDGRNCCRDFSKIKHFHGKVLDYIEDENVVIIDIGKEVNVSNHDVFRIYSPHFSGSIPYLLNDSRSIKELGTYPRLSLVRVAVVDTQANISFCTILDDLGGKKIQKGSSLEYEVVGLDRPHFNYNPPKVTGRILDLEKFIDIMNSFHSKNELANLTLVRLIPHNQEEDPDLYLDFFINLLKISFPTGYIFSYLDYGRIAALSSTKNHPLTTENLKIVSSYVHTKFKIYVGSLNPILEEQTDGQHLPSINTLFQAHQSFSTKDLVHLAKACLFVAQKNKAYERLVLFNEIVLSSLLYESRSFSNLDEGIYEYHKFLEMGFDEQNMHVQGGLLLFASKNLDLLPVVEKIFEKGIFSPRKYYVDLNLAMVKVRMEKFLEGYGIFKNHASHLLKDEVNPIYLFYYAKSTLEVTQKKYARISLNRQKEIYKRALKYYKPSDFISSTWLSEIKKQLKLLDGA